jgi:putative transcriptional regulator
MSIAHHPSDEFLVAYAAGDLAETWSLIVATHLAMCPACRAEVARAEIMGGWVIEDAEPAASNGDALAAMLARVETVAPEPARVARTDMGEAPVLPQPLRGYAGGDVAELCWRRLGRNAEHIPLLSTRDGSKARLLRIPAGRPVPEHGHNGVELTLVLAGSFCDGEERFARGDVEVVDSDLTHRPVAEPGTDCVCLAVTEAPLRFKSPLVRLVQPLIGI